MVHKVGILLMVCFFGSIKSFPQMNTGSLVITSTTPGGAEATKETKDDRYKIPKIYEMRIESNVSNRYAKSLITSKVKNLDKKAQEAVFSVVIPEQAFISGFVMEIDGKDYEAYIQEKEQAKNTYDAAVAGGQAAGHVAVSARDTNRFTVSVNIEPQSKAIFYLKYEELLSRQSEKYQIVINVHPGQLVENLEAKVNIDESRPLKFVRTPSLRTGNEIVEEDQKLQPNADINKTNKTAAVVIFHPNIEKQKQLANDLKTKEDDGFAGQFIVEYDIERDPHGGEVLVNNGYFVHFFAPTNLSALPKQVVFVLDTSGSMEGTRIMQLKKAMKSILSELNKEDVFNIVEFNSIAKVWNVPAVAVQHETGMSYWSSDDEDKENPFKNRTQQPLPPAQSANTENINKAEQVINKLNALGGTDIQSALSIAIQLVEKNQKICKKHQPLIIFLTDGEPTVGETVTEKIISTVSELNQLKTPIFSLSFGDGADRKFLEKLSLKNFGFARHIYEAGDASLQLQQFYKQISSPLMSNVSFKYVSNVTEVTKRHFPTYFGGSEIVVAGLTDENFLPPKVEGLGINGPVEYIPQVETAVSSLERLWAYLSLKQILEQREQADNKTGPTQEALRIALKYSFVSDVSSLVVVKPNATSAVNTEDGSKNNGGDRIIGGGIGGPGPLSFAFGAPLSAYPAPNAPFMNFYPTTPLRPFYQLTALEDSEPFESVSQSSFSSTTAQVSSEYATQPTTELDSSKSVNNSAHPEFDNLKHELPWLASILNENNRTISLSSGTYELSLNDTLAVKPGCSNTLSNVLGDCVSLQKCPQMFTKVPDLTTYEKYFCDLDGFAGICCPKPQNTTEKN